MITNKLLKSFLMLFIIWSGTVTASVVDKLKDKEKLFGSIQNRTIKYSLNPDSTKLTSLACFDQEKNGMKKCNIAENFTVLSYHPNWKSSNTVTLDYSDYESKETEIITGLEYPDIILMTLLKSKKSGKVFIDIKYSKKSKYSEKIWQNVIEHKFEVGASMWSGNKKPIVNLFKYSFQIFYENPKGNKILRTTFAESLREPKTNEVFPEYSWSEIDQIIFYGQNKYAVFSHKYLYLSSYSRASDYDDHNRALDKKLKFENLKVTEIENVQLYEFPNWHKLLITAISIEKSKSQLFIVNEDEMKVEISLTLDLQPNVNKAYFYIDEYRYGDGIVYLIESHCEPKTGDCIISLRKVNFGKKEVNSSEEVTFVNTTDCKSTDVHNIDYRKESIYIFYVCNKNLGFGKNNILDYLLFRGIHYDRHFERPDDNDIDNDYITKPTETIQTTEATGTIQTIETPEPIQTINTTGTNQTIQINLQSSSGRIDKHLNNTGLVSNRTITLYFNNVTFSKSPVTININIKK